MIEGEAPARQVLPEKTFSLLQKVHPSQTTLEDTPVDREVYGGEMSPKVMDVLRVISTPGHSSGYLSFCQPERQLVFCGDVMVRRLGWLPFAAVTVDEDENKHSVRKLAGLDTATMCFGHGAPLVRNTALRVRDFAKQVGVE